MRDPLSVMTFNVRQMDGEDGEHCWEFRKDVLAETIRLYQPSILGTQETFPEQARFIHEQIPAFDCFGRGRFGDERDKHNKIFFDRRLFCLEESGAWWFSETPSIPGTRAWGIPQPRMMAWGILRLHGTDHRCAILNTHLPYGRTGEEARLQSARLIVDKLADFPPDLPLFLTGDFNTLPDSPAHSLLTSELHDAWLTAEHTTGPAGTLHGFGRTSAERRLDWILYRNAGKTLMAETVTHRAGGLFPSDHFPVIAMFSMR